MTEHTKRRRFEINKLRRPQLSRLPRDCYAERTLPQLPWNQVCEACGEPGDFFVTTEAGFVCEHCCPRAQAGTIGTHTVNVRNFR